MRNLEQQYVDLTFSDECTVGPTITLPEYSDAHPGTTVSVGQDVMRWTGKEWITLLPPKPNIPPDSCRGTSRLLHAYLNHHAQPKP